ncbi:MAG: GNAT family N-acetyltransferase [Bacteroidales bacterium]|nr:GNAT family N-acetyltransferase [Bacteroidales bacterium]
MPNTHVKERLKIKSVELEDIDQYNELLRYVFQVSRFQLFESGYEEGELIRSKRPILKEADVFGWFTEDDQLVSQICIYPFQVNIHGEIFKMGGITGVGTYPEYANLGLMNDLIKLALEKMRKNGQLISYLYPYSIPYYRRKGWEIISDHLTFEIKDTQLPSVSDVPGHIERLKVDAEDVKQTYNRFARTNHGAMIRGKFEWDEYWRWENEEKYTAGVYYDSEDRPQGYVLYWIEEDVFSIKEIIWMNQEARKGLWNFIHAHFSMIDWVKGDIYVNEPLAFLLDDGHIKETIEPYYMGRIVDLEAFLQKYPFEGSIPAFHFIVTDPLAEWNNGIFTVSKEKDGPVKVSKEPEGKAVTLDIQTLTTLLMSYRNPSYLKKVELLNTDAATLRLLEEIIPDQSPYFSDYF